MKRAWRTGRNADSRPDLAVVAEAFGDWLSAANGCSTNAWRPDRLEALAPEDRRAVREAIADGEFIRSLAAMLRVGRVSGAGCSAVNPAERG